MSYITKSFDERVIELLKKGGAGFMPSDTIYGLSARALDEQAVEKVHALKKRDSGKPFIVLISDINQLSELGVDWTDHEELAKKYWPGALTIVLLTASTPAWLTKGLSSLAVRLPDNENILDLIDKVGPIISTSANEAGRPAINDPAQAVKNFGEALDFYVDVGQLSNSQPSTIIKPNGSNIEILRQGAVKIT